MIMIDIFLRMNKSFTVDVIFYDNSSVIFFREMKRQYLHKYFLKKLNTEITYAYQRICLVFLSDWFKFICHDKILWNHTDDIVGSIVYLVQEKSK